VLTSEIISLYLKAVTEAIKADALAKDQKIPVSSFRIEVDEKGGRLYAADYFKYIVEGRGPGKAPPPDKMEEWLRKNLHVLDSARDIYDKISLKSLAFLIGRKIAKEGTDVFQGKKQKIDIPGSITVPMDEFLQQLAYWKALNVIDKIRKAA